MTRGLSFCAFMLTNHWTQVALKEGAWLWQRFSPTEDNFQQAALLAASEIRASLLKELESTWQLPCSEPHTCASFTLTLQCLYQAGKARFCWNSSHSPNLSGLQKCSALLKVSFNLRSRLLGSTLYLEYCWLFCREDRAWQIMQWLLRLRYDRHHFCWHFIG